MSLGAVPADAMFPSGARLGANDLAWAHVAESIDLLAPQDTLRLVSASLDGSQIADVLHVTAFGYTPLGWQPECPGGPNCPPVPCDNPNNPMQCFASLHAPDGDPLFVLSALRRELYVIAAGIDAIDVTSGARRTIDLPGITLGTLLAATYEGTSGRLYVLDEVSLGHGRSRRRTVRLVAIDPERGAPVVLASWPRLSRQTRFALGGGADGRLYIAASGESGGHVLVSLEIVHHEAERRRAAWDDVVPRGIATGEGVLASHTTYANRYAVTFVIERSGHLEVAAYDPGAPHFRPGDCIGDVF